MVMLECKQIKSVSNVYEMMRSTVLVSETLSLALRLGRDVQEAEALSEIIQ